MTALEALLRAAIDGRACGDDAAVRAAWESETHAKTLLWATAWLPRTLEMAAWGAHGGAVHQGCVCKSVLTCDDWSLCPACCAAIRAAVRCPTAAELAGTVLRNLLRAIDDGDTTAWERDRGIDSTDEVSQSAAVNSAWYAENDPETLFDALRYAGDTEGQTRAGEARWRFWEAQSAHGDLRCDCKGDASYLYGRCMHCCDVIRATVECPRWDRFAKRKEHVR